MQLETEQLGMAPEPPLDLGFLTYETGLPAGFPFGVYNPLDSKTSLFQTSVIPN